MAFTDFGFWAIFLPIIFILICILRKSIWVQNIILLVASVIFYSLYDIKYIIFLLLSIVLTWGGGILGKKFGKRIYILAAGANIFLLLIFKYTGFILGNINYLLQPLGYSITLPSILLPVGLSFFIFQSTTYLFDLYNDKVELEKNLINYGLFVAFFPTIISGPIQKSRDMLPQIRKRESISYRRFQNAFILFLWGFFLKNVVADRFALFANQVFDNYAMYEGMILLLGAVVYSIQIYTDFQGYSCMAIGIAKALGFDLNNNFNQPYFATNIADFWRRWHISLTSWFREYVYFPLGGNRKGIIKKYRNIFIIFLISGLWHGAAWNYLIWGGLHAIYQIIGDATLKYRVRVTKALNIDRESFAYRLWQRLFVFFIVMVAWIFFRATSLNMAIDYITRMFSTWNPWILFDGSLETIGISLKEGYVYLCILMAVFLVSLFREKGKSAMNFIAQPTVFRYIVYAGLIVSIVVWGIYGAEFSASSFIYAGF